MANSKVFPTPIATGDKVSATQFNGLDDGQANAVCRTGVTALTGATTWEGGGYAFAFDFSDDSASQGQITVGAQNFDVVIAGAGNFRVPAGDLELTGTGWPVLASRSVRRSQNAGVDASTSYPFAPGYGGWQQGLAGAALYVHADHLIDGATITQARVRFLGQSSAGFVSLPSPMPTLELWKTSGTTGAATQLGSTATDGAATVGDFNAIHSIIISSLSEVVDQSAGDAYWLKFTGAGATNYVNNELLVVSFDLQFTVTDLRCLALVARRTQGLLWRKSALQAGRIALFGYPGDLGSF